MKFLLGDSIGNFAVWEVEIPGEYFSTPERKVPMLISANSHFMACGDRVYKNRLNVGRESIALQWKNSPLVAECRKNSKLIGIKASNGFSIGETDVPVHFVAQDSNRVNTRYYKELKKAKLDGCLAIEGFDVKGNKVFKSQLNKDGKYSEEFLDSDK